MKLRISKAVGVNQPNNISDVKKIQMLLNRAIRDDKMESLKEDGLWGPKTFSRLIYFQTKFVHLPHVDAIVNVHGPTFKRLNQVNAVAHHSASTHQKQAAVVPDSNQLQQLAQRASLPLPAIKSAWINRALPAAINVKRNWGSSDSGNYCSRGPGVGMGTSCPGKRVFWCEREIARRQVYKYHDA